MDVLGIFDEYDQAAAERRFAHLNKAMIFQFWPA